MLHQLFLFFVYYRDTDGAIVRPLPRIKRALSEATCLPHIVQVALLLILTDFPNILMTLACHIDVTESLLPCLFGVMSWQSGNMSAVHRSSCSWFDCFFASCSIVCLCLSFSMAPVRSALSMTI